jgi:hypothetical protein
VEQGYNVLYVDLENCEPILRNRLFARITQENSKTFDDPEVLKRAAPLLAQWYAKCSPARFVYKAVQPKTKVSYLHHVIEEEEEKFQISFDAVVVDYGERMLPSHHYEAYRHVEAGAFEELWAVGVVRKKLMIVPTQANRQKAERFKESDRLGKVPPQLGIEDINESQAKGFICSALIGVWQCPQDVDRQLMRSNVILNRKGEAVDQYPLKVYDSIATIVETDECFVDGIGGGRARDSIGPPPILPSRNVVPVVDSSGFNVFPSIIPAGGIIQPTTERQKKSRFGSSGFFRL